MNVFIFTGRITRDAKVNDETQSGTVCGFHVAVSPGRGSEDVWIYCTITGSKAAEIADDLYAGQIVTVEGRVMGRGDGPIYVTARNVIPHCLTDYCPSRRYLLEPEEGDAADQPESL